MKFLTADKPVEYAEALSFMEDRVGKIHAGRAEDLVWLLEHPPLYTAGTSAKAGDLLNARFPVHETGRGGEYTYHGPGQRVGYVMLNLKKFQEEPDIKKYIYHLEEWVIRSLAHFGVTGERREGRVGIWVETPSGDKKIAAIGVRIRHWVAYHGVAINVNPDLTHFGGIVPCGIREFGVTSLQDLGIEASLAKLDDVLRQEFDTVFKVQGKAA